MNLINDYKFLECNTLPHNAQYDRMKITLEHHKNIFCWVIKVTIVQKSYEQANVNDDG